MDGRLLKAYNLKIIMKKSASLQDVSFRFCMRKCQKYRKMMFFARCQATMASLATKKGGTPLGPKEVLPVKFHRNRFSGLACRPSSHRHTHTHTHKHSHTQRRWARNRETLSQARKVSNSHTQRRWARNRETLSQARKVSNIVIHRDGEQEIGKPSRKLARFPTLLVEVNH